MQGVYCSSRCGCYIEARILLARMPRAAQAGLSSDEVSIRCTKVDRCKRPGKRVGIRAGLNSECAVYALAMAEHMAVEHGVYDGPECLPATRSNRQVAMRPLCSLRVALFLGMMTDRQDQCDDLSFSRPKQCSDLDSLTLTIFEIHSRCLYPRDEGCTAKRCHKWNTLPSLHSCAICSLYTRWLDRLLAS